MHTHAKAIMRLREEKQVREHAKHESIFVKCDFFCLQHMTIAGSSQAEYLFISANRTSIHK